MTMAGRPAHARRVRRRARGAAAAASGWVVLLAGCGLAANPQPPTLWLPAPVKDLAAARVGDEAHLHWTMPKETTDKVALRGDQRAHVCWEVPEAAHAGSGAVSEGSAASGRKASQGRRKPGAETAAPGFDPAACEGVGDGMFAPGKAADFTVRLPGELTAGEPRAVALYVELQNHAGKTAGPSNAAWVAAGAGPPAVTGLRLETKAAGVVLHWEAAAPEKGMVLRMERTLVAEPGAPRTNESLGVPAPEQQTLEVDLDQADPGGAVDRDAGLDHTWKYAAERVLKVDLGGHALEIAGAAAEPVTIDAKDVFPPAIPAGLAAVTDDQAKAIDLSWTPDTDADLAGYFVYRRDETAGTGWERITGKRVVAPAYSDGTVMTGHKYAYAVTAVDEDGNESGKSGAVEEELTQ